MDFRKRKEYFVLTIVCFGMGFINLFKMDHFLIRSMMLKKGISKKKRLLF